MSILAIIAYRISLIICLVSTWTWLESKIVSACAAGILFKLNSIQYSFFIRFCRFFLRFSSSWKSNVLFGKHFYTYVRVHTNQTVTYWTKLFFKKRFLRRVKQPYFEISLSSFIIGVARIFDWGPPKPQITYVNTKKKVFTVRLKSLDWGGGVKFCWRPI